MRLWKNPMKWIRWGFLILGILGLWNYLPGIMKLVYPGTQMSYAYYLIFLIVLGLWIGLIYIVYRVKAVWYRVILGIMAFASLALFLLSWFFVNSLSVNKNIDLYAQLLLGFTLVASVIDAQNWTEGKNT